MAGRSILLVVENLPVPYDRRVWQEALALKAAGFQVSVISPATKSHPKLSEFLEGVHIYRYPMMIEGQGHVGLIVEYVWSFPCIFLWSIFVALRRGFKVIMIANPPEIFFPIIWMWRLFGKKTVFDHHDLTPELFATKFKTDRSVILSFFYFAERRMLRVAHKVISTNESYKAIAMKRGRRTSEDVLVIRNSPDPARFSVRQPEPELRKSAEYLLAFLGEIGQQDGVDILIRAIKSIRAALGPDSVHCVILGAGPHYDNIVAYAKDQGVSDNITFTGRADNDTICRVLSTADIGVDPCPWSPHANLSTATKIMEYMFFSLPIVAFDLTETRYSGADTVRYARIDDEADFARQVIDLLQDEARRRAFGQAGRRRLDTALSWRVSARNLVTVMDGLVGGVPMRRAEDFLVYEERELDDRQEVVAVERRQESEVETRQGLPPVTALLGTPERSDLEHSRIHIS
jgi:glycosyltransferase involved in cell wall biosynthesis